jgi:L-malate glycosyltransferase
MKLGIVSNVSGYSWAGSELVWYLSAMQALREDHQVAAFLHPDIAASKQVAEFRLQGGMVKIWKPLPIARFQKLKERFFPTFSSSSLDSLDVILVSLGSLPAICNVPGLVEALLRTKVPIVLLTQFNADHLYISPQEREFVARIIQKSHSCVFVSQRNLDETRRQFAIEPPRAAVISNPIREQLVKPLAWPAKDSPVQFACVARFETAWKGQDLLLDVLSRSPWQERDWHLTFYGSGPDKEYLQRLTTFLEMENRVIFAGHIESLHEIWAKSHLLLLPSHGEGGPLAALEAMMFGRPVVMTDVGLARELVCDGQNGFLAEGSTAFSFNLALERAWQLRAHWAEMGIAAHFTANKQVEKDPVAKLLDICLAAGINSH